MHITSLDRDGKKLRIEYTDSIQRMHITNESAKSMVHRWELFDEDTNALLDRGTAPTKGEAEQRADAAAQVVLKSISKKV